MTRVIVVTGKGGVGKTTVAAATALACADRGLRTVVTSTDPAHSLADALGVPLGSDPREIAPRCAAQQMDARERMEAAWGDLKEWLHSLFDWAGIGGIEAEELAVLPGLEELLALSELQSLARSGAHDVIVVDCAPTAETIRLLSLPEVLDWYMRRLFPVTRRVNRVVGPVVGRLTSVPVADDRVFAAVERLHGQLAATRDLLADSAQTSVRLVLTPERVVLAEGRRTFTYLSLFGYHVDAVVVNRVLPPEVTDPFFTEWRRNQAEQLAAVEEGFAGVPVLRAAHAPAEPVGVTALREVGRDLYGDRNPESRFVLRPPLRIVDEDGPVVELNLAFAVRGDLDVAASGEELFVRYGPYRRCVRLPDSLLGRPVTRADLRDGVLRVRFGPLR